MVIIRYLGSKPEEEQMAANMATNQEFGFKDYVLYRWGSDKAAVRRMVDTLVGDLTEEELNWQANPGFHSMWHHVWHMFLCIDYYFAGAFGLQSVWEQGDWPHG